MIEIMIRYEFMRNAVLAAFFISLICGIVGTIIVEKHLVNMAGGIAHASFGGIGLGFFLKVEPIVVGIVFSVLCTMGITAINKISNTNKETLVHMLWASGMAIGIFFISITKGYPPNMTSYFFGDILAITRGYLVVLVMLSVLISFSICGFFKYWQAFLFDDEHMQVRKFNIFKFEIILMIIIAITVVLVIKAVGIILVIALLTIPTAIAKVFTKCLYKTMIISVVSSILLCYGGLYMSYFLNIPTGATIILLGIAVYLIVILIDKLKAA